MINSSCFSCGRDYFWVLHITARCWLRVCVCVCIQVVLLCNEEAAPPLVFVRSSQWCTVKVTECLKTWKADGWMWKRSVEAERVCAASELHWQQKDNMLLKIDIYCSYLFDLYLIRVVRMVSVEAEMETRFVLWTLTRRRGGWRKSRK